MYRTSTPYTAFKATENISGPGPLRPFRLSFRRLFVGAYCRRACVPSPVLWSAQHPFDRFRGNLPIEPPALQGFGTLFDVPLYLVL